MNDGDINAVSRSLGELHAQIAYLTKTIDQLTKTLDFLAKDHAALKNKGIGALIGVGLAGGSIGAFISSKFQQFFLGS